MNNNCILCQSPKYEIIHKGVRDNSDIDVLKCQKCGLVYLSEFLHSADGYYQDSKMWKKDEGKSIADWQLQTKADDLRRYEQHKECVIGKRILDFGCGNGGFLALVSPISKLVAGVEQDMAAASYIKDEMNIGIYSDLNEVHCGWDCIFLFHVIEHLPNPVDVLTMLAEKLETGGEIIIETPNSNDALLSVYNCDAFADFTYWSAHVVLYDEQTLSKMIEKTGLKVNWIKQFQRYPFTNHLRWIQKGLPGGGIADYPVLNDDKLNFVYNSVLANNKCCDTIICSICRK